MAEQQQSTENNASPSAVARWFKRLLFGTLLAIIVLVASLAGGRYWLNQWALAPLSQFSAKDIVVARGDSAHKVINRLKVDGQITHSEPFKALFIVQPELAQLKAGHYAIPAHVTPAQLLEILGSGIEKQFSVTFIEGSTFSQWLAILKNHPQIAFEAQRVNDYVQSFKASSVNEEKYRFARVEGQFFPDTYHFTDQTPAIAILKRANIMLEQKLTTLWQDRDKTVPLSSKHDALVLASIIEKETGMASERPEIASAFVNRINRRMRLQTDPTVIYGMADVYDGDITYAHMRDKNAYNTYVIKGLPPTPIAMVSEGAIHAALNPATTPYIYFVASGDGGHVFSTNLKDHNRATKRYLEKLKQ
ncbi:MAG: endolytic transglycosylase MltG [Psychrobium sp.]